MQKVILPLNDDQCDKIVELVENGFHIDEAFRNLGLSFTKWDKSSDDIKERLRRAGLSQVNKSFTDNERLLEKKEIKVEVPATHSIKEVLHPILEKQLPLKELTEGRILMNNQFKSIIECMGNRSQFEYQMKNRLDRLVEHRIITQEQRGKIEFCLLGIQLTTESV